MSDARKVGVYICKGCGIGGSVDVDDLTTQAANDAPGAVIKTSSAFCLEDAESMRKDVADGQVDTVVIAACSPRVKTDVFGLRPAIVERVNLREQVAWSHPPQHEETQSLARDLLKMGIVRAQKNRVVKPYQEANERSVLVVGGGVAGLSAAQAAAKAGFRVVLVEKDDRLGGFAIKLKKQFPKRPPYRDLESVRVDELVHEIESARDIHVLTGAEVEKVSGQPGRFEARIKRNGGIETATVGAIVLATGWHPYDARSFEKYGFGKLPNVVSSVAFEEIAANGPITRPSDGRPVSRMAILQCEGAADEAHLPYSGNVTSLVSLKQAAYLRENNPHASVYLFYQDMQTPGSYEYFYKRMQEDDRIFFSRGEVRAVSAGDGNDVVLEIENSLLGASVRLRVDLLVLAVGMVPAAKDSALNLQYLQGKELPQTKFGFADSHFICFPYETRRTGIYSAGCVRAAMDLASAASDGSAAALKAIQSIEKSTAGQAVHPRVGDLSYPSFFMPKCTSCGRCSQECPFGALEVDAKKHPVLDTNRCRRCGICMGACPVQIISFDDYSVEMLSAMIKSVEMPEGDDEKPRILALACENDAYPAIDMAGIERRQYPASIRVIPVRCLGSVNSVVITDALSHGFDGVAMLGCKSGDDYQCHFIVGSGLSQIRMRNVSETLERLALEAERVGFMEVEITAAERIPAMLGEFVERIKKLGLNPFKGF
jgi:quinone-modifying oxidoreductase, subunit QmoB